MKRFDQISKQLKSLNANHHVKYFLVPWIWICHMIVLRKINYRSRSRSTGSNRQVAPSSNRQVEWYHCHEYGAKKGRDHRKSPKRGYNKMGVMRGQQRDNQKGLS